MNNWVLDASAAFGVLQPNASQEVLQAHIMEADVLLAPTIYFAETAQVLWKYRRFADMVHEESVQLLLKAEKLIDIYILDQELREEAFLLAVESGNTVYDMLYVALALREKAGLLSLDKKLNRWASKQGIRIFS